MRSDLSYASSAATRRGQAVVRLLENATGRLQMIKRATGYEAEIARGVDFWQVMLQRFGLSVDIFGGALANIPCQGPVIVVANHPFGILDGMVMGHILSQARSDFRILANAVFGQTAEMDRVILPISFDETRAAVRTNLDSRKAALKHLQQGGVVGVFPGGTVSTAAHPFGHPMDPAWRVFTARMVAKSKACVVPIYFEGHTSRLFQIASHVHMNLRLGLLINSFKKSTDRAVRLSIGAPIGRDVLDPLSRESKQMMDFLRKATYELSANPIKSFDLGYDFEDRHRA